MIELCNGSKARSIHARVKTYIGMFDKEENDSCAFRGLVKMFTQKRDLLILVFVTFFSDKKYI